MDIRELAARVGCPVVERNAKDSYTFDGKTIASKRPLFLGFQDEENYEGEIWGEVAYTDHALLHEVCHYLVALPEQRDLPEYGCELDPDTLGIYGDFRRADGTLGDAFDYHGCVDKEEQDAQEVAVWLLVVHLGPLFGINPLLRDAINISTTWKVYQNYKIEQAREFHSQDLRRARRRALDGIRFLRQKLNPSTE